MKRSIVLAALLALTFAPEGFGQEQTKKKTDDKTTVTTQTAASGVKHERSGTDCTRPGGKCNKRKPRKPWFFGN